MTEQDKFMGAAAKDFEFCRRNAWASRAWQCLWNTAWFGPHGFITGNNLEETDEDAQKHASCHCYCRPLPALESPRSCDCSRVHVWLAAVKWFFEKPAHVESVKEKRARENREQHKYAKDERPGIRDVVPGKNLFIHLFFGVLFGWLIAVLNTFFTGGDAPWISYYLRQQE